MGSVDGEVDGPKTRGPKSGGYRFLVVLGVLVSVFVYTMGAVMTGVAYRLGDGRGGCTREGLVGPAREAVQAWGYRSALVVVGPCFMAAGGAIVTFIIFQWCLCRPVIRD